MSWNVPILPRRGSQLGDFSNLFQVLVQRYNTKQKEKQQQIEERKKSFAEGAQRYLGQPERMRQFYEGFIRTYPDADTYIDKSILEAPMTAEEQGMFPHLVNYASSGSLQGVEPAIANLIQARSHPKGASMPAWLGQHHVGEHVLSPSYTGAPDYQKSVKVERGLEVDANTAHLEAGRQGRFETEEERRVRESNQRNKESESRITANRALVMQRIARTRSIIETGRKLDSMERGEFARLNQELADAEKKLTDAETTLAGYGAEPKWYRRDKANPTTERLYGSNTEARRVLAARRDALKSRVEGLKSQINDFSKRVNVSPPYPDVDGDDQPVQEPLAPPDDRHAEEPAQPPRRPSGKAKVSVELVQEYANENGVPFDKAREMFEEDGYEVVNR